MTQTVLELTRSPESDLHVMSDVRDRMEALLKGPHAPEDLLAAAGELVRFQTEDGSFSLLGSLRGVPSDAWFDFYTLPTCLGASLLSLAVLADENCLGGAAKAALARALKACLRAGFAGHGYDAAAGHMLIMACFMYGRVDELTERDPDLCPEFREVLLREQYTPVFVYGTLMRDRSNHCFLEDSGSEFLRSAEADGYALYDLGAFPGAVRCSDSRLKGEVYLVSIQTLRALDRLEGEGSLYARRIYTFGWADPVWIYEYLLPVTGAVLVPEFRQPWRKDMSDYIWYVAYGSNMLKERFRCYIEGGTCRENGREYAGCDDRTEPLASVRVSLPGKVYYANRSGSWGGSGVAFLDETAPGHTMGRAWLVTRDQFRDIRKQEGSGPNWYNRQVDLGTIDGLSAATFTHAGRLEDNEPADAYVNVIKKGKAETAKLQECSIDRA